MTMRNYPKEVTTAIDVTPDPGPGAKGYLDYSTGLRNGQRKTDTTDRYKPIKHTQIQTHVVL